VLDTAGRIDEAASVKQRERVRADRLARLNGKAKARRLDGTLVFNATDNLDVRRDGANAHWACAQCAADLGPLSANYKDGCLREDSPVSASNPLVGDPRLFVDDDVAFRRFYCPGCGAEIENEIAVERDPPLRDIEIMA
jgi:N-methylhydantoinase B